MKKLLPIILIITLLLVGCGSVSEETTPTTESAVATWGTLETSQPETMEATIPEPTEPQEVWVYPAVLPKNGGYVFGCEIVNTLETTASVTSIIVVDTLGGNEVAVQEFVPGGVPHEMARGALTDLDPFGATVFHPVLKEDKINFDHRIITVNLEDTLGNTQTQEFRFTMDAGEATNSSFPDDEAWEPALYDGGYDAWRFYHSLVNYTDETLTLCGIYEVDYLDGVPINTWIPRGKDLEQKNIQVISTLVPGVAANLQNGITMEFATENQVKTIFVYQDSKGNYVPLTSRLILEQDVQQATWPVPEARDGYWELTMEVKNNTDGELTVDAVYQTNSAASVTPQQIQYPKNQLNLLGISDTPLAPGEAFDWHVQIPQALQAWEQIRYTVCLRDEKGNSSLQEFYFSFPLQPGIYAPGSPEGYDMLLALGYVPLSSGYPQYTLGQIQEMIDQNLTMDQVAEKISTIADLIQYLHLKGFQSDPRGDLKFSWDGIRWHVNRSAQTVFNDNAGDCGGGAIWQTTFSGGITRNRATSRSPKMKADMFTITL